MRAIIYARYSTDRQADSSIADQLRVCRQYAEQRGWQVIAEHRDEGISGAALGNRPGVRAALAHLQRGDVLVVMDLSRLSRSQDIGPLIEQQRFRGARVVGVQDGYDSSSRTARMQAGMSGIMSEEFRAQIADRTRSAMQMRAEHGESTGGRAYGYAADEGAVVKDIFDRWAGGDSLKQIASELNRRGVPSPGARWQRKRGATHGRWLVSALHALIQNERYAGRLIYNRSQWTREPGTGIRKRTERPESEWIVRQVEPLIDERTWRAAQSRFRATGARPAGKYMLSGLLVCASCGARMTIMGGSQHRYICGTHHNGGPHACSNGLSVPRALAELHILEPVVSRLLDPDAISEAIRQMRAEDRAAPRSADKQQVESLRRMVREGTLSAEVAAPAIAEAQRRAARQTATPLPTAREWRQAVAGMRELLQGDDVVAAREALLEWIGEIPMQPQGDHYIATVQARQVVLATGTTGISVGSGGAIQIRIPCRAEK